VRWLCETLLKKKLWVRRGAVWSVREWDTLRARREVSKEDEGAPWGWDSGSLVFRLFVSRRAHDTPSRKQGAMLKRPFGRMSSHSTSAWVRWLVYHEVPIH